MTTSRTFVIAFTTAAFALLSACASSSSTGPKDCTDAGAVNGSCDTIANEIKANGGGPGTCLNPSAKFAKACATLAACSQCVGSDGGI